MSTRQGSTTWKLLAVMIATLALLIAQLGPVARAQSDLGPLWLEQFGTPAHDDGRAVVAAAGGGAFTLGSSVTYVEHTADGEIRRGPDDAFVAHHDAAGRHQWTTRLAVADAPTDTEGAVIIEKGALAPNGDLVVAGRTRGTFAGQSRTGSEEDAFVARLSPAGQLLWVRQLGAGPRTAAFAVTVDDGGDIYLGGFSSEAFPEEGHERFDAGFLARFDSAGTRAWVRAMGDVVTGVAVDGVGGVHAVGSWFPFGAESSMPYWAVYDTDGEEQDFRDLRDHSFDHVHPVSAGPGNEIWIAGYEGSGTASVVRAGRFAPDGTPTWVASVSNPHPDARAVFVGDAAVDSDGSLVLAVSMMIDPPGLQQRHTAAVARMGPAGQLEWFHTVPYDRKLPGASGVDVDGVGAIYVSGRAFGGADPAERAVVARYARDGAPGSGPGVAEPEPGVARISGGDRFSTAAAVAERFDPAFVHTVYLTTGLNFPDALAAGPAAVLEGAPILLTTPGSLVSSTRMALERLDPDVIVVLGGQSAVSDVVAHEAAAAAGATFERVSGPDRFTTAAALADRVTAFGEPPWVSLATGFSFPDALAGGALAADIGAPILLTPSTSLAAPSAEVLGEIRPDQVVVFGGQSALSDDTAQAAAQAAGGADVLRLSGPDRFSTAARIAAEFPAPVSEVLIATATSFPDALAGTPLAGTLRVPLLLVHPDFISPSVEEQLQRLRPARITILGGAGAVSPEVAEQLQGYLR